MQLLGNTKSKINKDENNHNVIEITEVLAYCNIVSNDYQLDSRVCYSRFIHLFLIIHSVNY